MTKTRFWKIIDVTREGDADFSTQVARLDRILRSLPRKDVHDFDGIFNEFRHAADRKRLQKVAKEFGYGGDDGWMDFRSWLISRGRDAYKAGLRDPETLREIAAASDDVLFEEFAYVAGHIIDGEASGAG